MTARFPHLAVDSAPLLLFDPRCRFVLTHVEIAELFLKISEALEPLRGKLARGDRTAHRAIGFLAVSAVAVAARLG